MSSQKPSKNSKPPNQTAPSRSSSASSSSSLSSHLAMVELKQRVLTSLSKLSDRDTHQIAVEDLEKIITSLSNDGISMLLNCLYDAVNDPKPAVKKEGVRLLAVLCAVHTDAAATHLTKVVAHIVKRLKDSDSQIRETCRDAIGSLAGLYLKGGNGGDGVVSLFVKPLFEVMNENNKASQGGAALCLSKMVECASDPPLTTFQKLCTRVCKYLNSPNFMAKASLLHVVSSLSQVGAIAPQSLESLLQTIHHCLSSPDWATRKAAADTLIVLASNISNITAEGAASTLNALEACRFDKVKPVRESMNEALQLWNKIAGKGDASSDENKASSHDGGNSESTDPSNRKNLPDSGDRESAKPVKDSSCGSSPTDPNLNGKGNNILYKAVGILKKKASGLTDKALNPEFFQKLETRVSDDLPVEVVVPRRCVNPSNSQNEEESESNADPSEMTRLKSQTGDRTFKMKHESMERGTIGDRGDYNQRESSSIYSVFSRTPGQAEGLMSNKGNWLAIQRQLLLLERQQAHLMSMLQDFMGGSHDSMVTLEDRVRGLERVVDDMARDLSISSGRMGDDHRFEGPSNRSLSKYNGFSDYSSGKLVRGSDGRTHFGERFAAFDGLASGIKLRVPSWRSDGSDFWDFHHGKNGQMGSRRGGLIDIRSGKSENENDQVCSRRAWEKGAGPVRFGEGPSARSVWQASKDEATLEAIRVAGEDSGVAQKSVRVAIPEMTVEALGDDGEVRDRDPVWTAWTSANDALHVGDMDCAFAEVLTTGDDNLLVKLMERSGAVMDQLSSEVACEVVNAVSQLIVNQNLFEMCLYWVQQLADIVMENGPDVIGIPIEVKRDVLLNLHEASSSFELPDDWEGSSPDQLLIQLASAWEINLEHLGK